MKELKITAQESIKDWVLRVHRHFSQHDTTLGQNIIKKIEQQMSAGFSESEAIKIRLNLINYVSDLFDAPGEIAGISFDEISSLDFIFFPDGFNSNTSCQFCLKNKEACICF